MYIYIDTALEATQPKERIERWPKTQTRLLIRPLERTAMAFELAKLFVWSDRSLAVINKQRSSCLCCRLFASNPSEATNK